MRSHVARNFQRVMLLSGCEFVPSADFSERHIIADITQCALVRVDQGSRVLSHCVSRNHGESGFQPLRSDLGESIGSFDPITQSDRNHSVMLTALNQGWKFNRFAILSCGDTHHIAVGQHQRFGNGGGNADIVVPRHFRDRIWEFLQPWIMSMPTVGQTDFGIQRQAVVSASDRLRNQLHNSRLELTGGHGTR